MEEGEQKEENAKKGKVENRGEIKCNWLRWGGERKGWLGEKKKQGWATAFFCNSKGEKKSVKTGQWGLDQKLTAGTKEGTRRKPAKRE